MSVKKKSGWNFEATDYAALFHYSAAEESRKSFKILINVFQYTHNSPLMIKSNETYSEILME